MSDSKSESSYISIRDIAKIAKVSTATVSRVINHPEQTSPAVYDRVQAIIKEYHYVPNQTVKSLFSRSSDSIAIFVYDMMNPFFITLIRELNFLAFEHKHALLICDTSNDARKEADYLDYCAAIRVKGIIVTEGFDFLSVSPHLHSSVVMFDRSGLDTWPSVQSDNLNAMSNAVNYLLNLNHRRIACVAPDNKLVSVRHRREGYRRSMQSAGLFRREYLYSQPGLLNVETGVRALNYFLSLPKPPTAIVCANDMIASGVLLRAMEMNINIPNNLSIIGFDGVNFENTSTQLTTVKQDVTAIAKTLFEICLNPPKEPQSHVIPTEFIYGKTCGWCNE